MSKPLSYQPLPNFGLNGLNTQSNPSSLDPSYLTSANNIVVRESGRISFRKGLKQKVLPSGVAIGSIVEHNDQGTNKIFASHGTSIYTIDFTTPQTAFPSSGADVKHTVVNSTGDWQFVNFNNRLHCFHAGVAPQRYDGAKPTGERWSSHVNATAINDGSNVTNSATSMTVDSTVGFPTEGTLLVEDEVISYTGITATTFTGMTRGVGDSSAATHANNIAVASYAVPASATTFDPSCGMGFYGKLWAGGITEAPDVLFYSVLLDGDDWNGTGSGFIDLKTVWGTDDIIGIAPFFGKLVIFGKNNIVIYDNPESGGTLALNEVIKGIGLVSRDTIQAIGDDLVFLSATGLRSLARTTEKDKLPMQDLSLNIKDTLIRNISTSNKVIKSIYLENEGIYILTFTNKNITYVFDFKHATPQQTPRITTWTFDNDREPTSMCYTETYGYLTGQKDGGIAGYEGYFDADYQASVVSASSLAKYNNASAPSASTSPTHSTTYSKVGTSSMWFAETTDSLYGTKRHANLAATEATKFNIGVSDFTIEAWFKNHYSSSVSDNDPGWGEGSVAGSTATNYALFDHQLQASSTNDTGFQIRYDINYIYVDCYTSGSAVSTITSSYHGLYRDDWAHIAVTKSGTTVTIWVNGVSKGTGTWASGAMTHNIVRLCSKISPGSFSYGNYGFIGFVDEVRYSKVARYSSTFTPSTTEFISDANTLLLIHSNESSSGSTTFVDSSTFPLTTHLNASYSTDISSPWILLGQTMASSLLKNMTIVLEGGSGATLGLKWYKDFSTTPSTTTSINLSPASTGASSKWGEALYGTSKYTPIYGLKEYRTPLSGSAKRLKLNMSIESNGYNASIQDLTLLHKEGKIR